MKGLFDIARMMLIGPIALFISLLAVTLLYASLGEDGCKKVLSRLADD